jgi:CYTH domain-containing protein
LNATEAETLSIFAANEIRKNRYYYEFEDRRFSVDMFIGDLFGLVLAETSFETDEELDRFGKPSFVIADVTNNEMFSGGKLSEMKYEDVRKEILRSNLLNARPAGNS